MKSPFPGMDPYLEAHWPDIHTSLVADSRNQLNRMLPEDLAATSEERVAIEAEDPRRPSEYVADVAVQQSHGVSTGVQQVLAVDAPFRLVAPPEPLTERFIRIVKPATGQLITVIEFLSPANKSSRGLRKYLLKRRNLLRADVNVVEVDLIRSGNWRALLKDHDCPEEAVSPYRVAIRVARDPDAVYLYPIFLHDPLPTITVPLRKDDPPVSLALQPLLDLAYVNGRYGTRLDYSRPPMDCTLSKDEEAWTKALLAERTK